MFIAALILVLLSGSMHAVWNLMTKKSLNKTVFLWSIHIVAGIILFPSFIYELTQIGLTATLLGFLALSFCFQAGYLVFLSKTYSYGEMSQVYPLMRGIGALLVPIASTFVYQESLSLMGWFGLTLIIVGLFFISDIHRGTKNQSTNSRKKLAILFAVLVGCCITGYTLVDKHLVGHFSPFAIIEISNISYIVISTRYVLRSKKLKQEWQRNWRTILVGSFFSPGSYILFLFAMSLAPLASIAPIREVGTVFGTLLGVLILKESHGARRIAFSAVITCGIITIALWR
ncbi:LuxR family transcriptional regulator [Paenibacillus albiflavus]|uniref:LuxR family transcriptional regulator n=1 Tax=Paenibacillus albiflavus TaxID=2545760 RepID=A0A4V2WPD9_9BACL|nr:SMR family transporter [Paenibacillus albiflavus]TCZ78962.1 LuxR family transcriptional regulator [Paenibacillus albiflavus]